MHRVVSPGRMPRQHRRSKYATLVCTSTHVVCNVFVSAKSLVHRGGVSFSPQIKGIRTAHAALPHPPNGPGRQQPAHLFIPLRGTALP